MLSIRPPNPSSPPTHCTPNLLPCRIQHNGPVNASSRYWNPEISKEGHPEAYFRGRKLRGREVNVPEGYKGVVVREERLDAQQDLGNRDTLGGTEEDVDEGDEEVKVLEEVGQFDELMVWEHESGADGEDVFVRGVEEWIGFAEAMCKPALGGKHTKGEKRS